MKAQSLALEQGQVDQQWIEEHLADRAWRNQRADQAEAVSFDAWISSPEGQRWIESEEARHETACSDFGYSWERRA